MAILNISQLSTATTTDNTITDTWDNIQAAWGTTLVSKLADYTTITATGGAGILTAEQLAAPTSARVLSKLVPGDYTIAVTGVPTVARLNALDRKTTGAITASITGTAVELKTLNVSTGNAYC